MPTRPKVPQVPRDRPDRTGLSRLEIKNSREWDIGAPVENQPNYAFSIELKQQDHCSCETRVAKVAGRHQNLSNTQIPRIFELKILELNRKRFRSVNAAPSVRRHGNDREQRCEQKPFAQGHDRYPSHTNALCRFTAYNLAALVVAAFIVPGRPRIIDNPRNFDPIPRNFRIAVNRKLSQPGSKLH